jgi:hypothetical protein
MGYLTAFRALLGQEWIIGRLFAAIGSGRLPTAKPVSDTTFDAAKELLGSGVLSN